MSTQLDVERAVKERYKEGAQTRVEDLCCPVSYDGRFLEVLPPEILERDYGCGDPSRHLSPGETVLDLGSGAGKICYIAAQVVGAKGRVIGVDFNPDMLELARRHQKAIGDKLGYHNVEFRRGRIQDLRTDLERPGSAEPMIPECSVDAVVSNCVLNLVRPEDKKALFAEMFRALKNGGRAVVSDIVSDEEPTAEMKADPELWSGCVSGAFEETAFTRAFEDAGFHGIEILSRQQAPWRTIGGIEFRSLTVRAWKGKQGPCWETNKAVIYNGPFSSVRDDDGHAYPRGVPIAVCEKTFQLLMSGSYKGHFLPVLPRVEVPLERALPFDCSRDSARTPRETKGLDYRASSGSAPTGGSCGPGCC